MSSIESPEEPFISELAQAMAQVDDLVAGGMDRGGAVAQAAEEHGVSESAITRRFTAERKGSTPADWDLEREEGRHLRASRLDRLSDRILSSLEVDNAVIERASLSDRIRAILLLQERSDVLRGEGVTDTTRTEDAEKLSLLIRAVLAKPVVIEEAEVS